MKIITAINLLVALAAAIFQAVICYKMHKLNKK